MVFFDKIGDFFKSTGKTIKKNSEEAAKAVGDGSKSAANKAWEGTVGGFKKMGNGMKDNDADKKLDKIGK